MKKGHRDGKIVDGQTYESALPEAYAKVKHERDQVVAGFNILKRHSDQTTVDLAELRTAARSLISTYYCDKSTRKLSEAFNNLESFL